MACRHLVGLRFAERCERPPKIPVARPRKASKKYGLAYEKLVAKATQGGYGWWWRFVDSNGSGFCQTDVVMLLDGVAFVLECKLTDVEQAYEQLQSLYVPVVEMALKRPAKGIIVARHLTRKSELSRVCATMGDAMKLASPHFFPTLHWIGRGPI